MGAKKPLQRAIFLRRGKDTALALGNQPPPCRSGRPDRPLLRPPREVPRRRITQSAPGRIALLHAIAHIELNAVDLALDIASRFTKTQLPVDFYHDWLGVADDEARHFLMLSDRLADLDAAYGDLPAHDGLWQAADATKHDLLARLAIAPLVLEARGLDVTPTMINRLKSVGDEETAQALGIPSVPNRVGAVMLTVVLDGDLQIAPTHVEVGEGVSVVVEDGYLGFGSWKVGVDEHES